MGLSAHVIDQIYRGPLQARIPIAPKRMVKLAITVSDAASQLRTQRETVYIYLHLLVEFIHVMAWESGGIDVDHGDATDNEAAGAPILRFRRPVPPQRDTPVYQEALDRLLVAYENKALVSRWHEEVVMQGSLAAIDTLVASDFIGYALGENIVARGRAGVKEFVRWYHTTFTERQLTLEDLIAEGEKVVARTALRGTYCGGWLDIPTADQQVRALVTTIYRITGGQIREARSELSDVHMLGQLGVLPWPLGANGIGAQGPGRCNAPQGR